MRKPTYSVSKMDPGMDESFEDLLSKYKQIQLELECIRKEESMALEPEAAPVRDHISDSSTASITGTKPGPGLEEPSEPDLAEKKVFQAFNIKPLRQKLPTPSDLDELRKKWAEQHKGGGGAENEGEQGKGWRCLQVSDVDDIRSVYGSFLNPFTLPLRTNPPFACSHGGSAMLSPSKTS